MLSTQYRLRLEAICEKIVSNEEVSLDDMIWANKLAKSNQSASSILRKARRQARNPDMQEGGLDDFMNQMDLGDPDPSNHSSGFGSPDDIVDGFRTKKLMIGDNVIDYVCIQTWDPIFECMRYHWVHKSEKNPVQFVKNLNPYEVVL